MSHDVAMRGARCGHELCGSTGVGLGLGLGSVRAWGCLVVPQPPCYAYLLSCSSAQPDCHVFVAVAVDQLHANFLTARVPRRGGVQLES